MSFSSVVGCNLIKGFIYMCDGVYLRVVLSFNIDLLNFINLIG